MEYKRFWDLQRCTGCIRDEMEQMTAPFCAAQDVTGNQLRMILALHHEGEQTVRQLAGLVHMADTNVSTQVKRLCERGLLQRRRHPHDERQVCISLSAKGHEMAAQFALYCKEYQGGLLRSADEKELEDIWAGYTALQHILQRKRKQPAQAQPNPRAALRRAKDE